MAKKPKLASLSIRPAKNGGHSVRHDYESQPGYSRGEGRMMMGAPSSEEHTFGPGDGHNLMKHIVAALALKGMSPQGGDEEPEE